MKLRQKFTIMIVPHSGNEPLKFNINLSTIIFLSSLLILLFSSFVYLSTLNISEDSIIEEKNVIIQENQINLDAINDDILSLRASFINFNEYLESITSLMDVDIPDSSAITGIGETELDSFFRLTPIDGYRSYELNEIEDSLDEATSILQEIQSIIASQRDLFRDIPSAWPIANNMGRVAMEFGPNIHPIIGQWYLHKGFDIAAPLGSPVLSSADGKVVEIGYNPKDGYGLYIVVRHSYGFKTQYSHLRDILVSEGQDILQGERIGSVGNTGVSTGPHLDFIIMLGTNVVDPSFFLNASNDFERGVDEQRGG